MSSTLSSSPPNGSGRGLEVPDSTDSRYPSRQSSYHEADAPPFAYLDQSFPTWLGTGDAFTTLPAPALPSIQSTESIGSAFSAPAGPLPSTSPAPYFPALASFAVRDNADLAGYRAAPWPAASPSTAGVDVNQDLEGIRRTKSTLSDHLARQHAGSSYPGGPRANDPSRMELDRDSRSRSWTASSSPTESGIKKSRRAQLQRGGNASRRSSIQLAVTMKGAKSAPEANLPPSTLRKPAQRKEDPDSDDGSSSGDEDTRYRPRTEGKELIFACPFYRRAPTRHMECMTRKLSRIQDVKQHLYRRHSQSRFYCPNCFKDFASPDPRDAHIREGDCKPSAPPARASVDGLSAQLQESLRTRLSRKLTAEEQWYEIWAIIFPDHPVPESAHLGTMISESVGMLRDFWRQEGQQLLRGMVRPSQTRTGLEEAELQGYMMKMLDKVQDHLSRDSAPSSKAPPTANVGAQFGQPEQLGLQEDESGPSPDDADASYKPAGTDYLVYPPPSLPEPALYAASNNIKTLGEDRGQTYMMSTPRQISSSMDLSSVYYSQDAWNVTNLKR